MLAPTTVATSSHSSHSLDRHDYRFVAAGALKASLILGVAKVFGAIWLNMQLGGTVAIARWHGIVPYLVFRLDQPHFKQVTTYSTIGAALVGTVVLGRAALTASRQMRRSAAALPIVLGTVWIVMVDLILHFIAVALLGVQLTIAFLFISRHADAIQAEALIQQ
jgi:hypothetical protein